MKLSYLPISIPYLLKFCRSVVPSLKAWMFHQKNKVTALYADALSPVHLNHNICALPFPSVDLTSAIPYPSLSNYRAWKLYILFTV